jgi:hypothetical protein
VPIRGRQRTKKRKKATEQAPPVTEGAPVPFLTQSALERPSAPELEGEKERGRLLSAIVFWAPAIVLLVLAAAVVWVVR